MVKLLDANRFVVHSIKLGFCIELHVLIGDYTKWPVKCFFLCLSKDAFLYLISFGCCSLEGLLQ